MKPALKNEIDRLKLILESNGLEFVLSKGASDDNIAEIERQIGFPLDENLKDLWKFTNGSNHNSWFAVFSDESTPCDFPAIEYAFEQWSAFVPYDNHAYKEYGPSNDKQDERIQPTLVHKFWFPFAEFNGFSTSVYFDADPTDKGIHGQIVVYQHDPDAIYYVAENFLEFFMKSNDLLQENAKEWFL